MECVDRPQQLLYNYIQEDVINKKNRKKKEKKNKNKKRRKIIVRKKKKEKGKDIALTQLSNTFTKRKHIAVKL